MKTAYVILLSLCLPLFGTAQDDERFYDCNRRLTLGAQFSTFIPVDETQALGFRIAYGGNFNVFYNLTPNNPIAQWEIGGRMGAGLTRGIRDRVILTQPTGAGARRTFYNSLFDLEVVGRYNHQLAPRVKGYYELAGGIRATSVQEHIRLDEYHRDFKRNTVEPLDGDVSFVFTHGAGVLIRLNRLIALDLGITHSYGSGSTFADLEAGFVDDDVSFVTGPVHTLNFNVGVRCLLTCRTEVDDDDRRFRRRRRGRTRGRPSYRRGGSSRSGGSIRKN